MKYYLAKSEPSVYSIDDLERDKKTVWDGVTNRTGGAGHPRHEARRPRLLLSQRRRLGDRRLRQRPFGGARRCEESEIGGRGSGIRRTARSAHHRWPRSSSPASSTIGPWCGSRGCPPWKLRPSSSSGCARAIRRRRSSDLPAHRLALVLLVEPLLQRREVIADRGGVHLARAGDLFQRLLPGPALRPFPAWRSASRPPPCCRRSSSGSAGPVHPAACDSAR